MKLGNYNIVKLTKVLYKAMEGISANLFISTRPEVHDKMQDFIVVSFPNRVYDNIGTGNTNCVIELHVRQKSKAPNMAKLSALQEAVYAKLPIDDDICLIHQPVSVNMGTDDIGFDAIRIYCKVRIK